MWPPVMPKRLSSSRGPSARRSMIRSGSCGHTSPKRAIAESAAATASVSGGKHWQNIERTCRPSGASVGSVAVWQAASIQGRAAGRPALASVAAAGSAGSLAELVVEGDESGAGILGTGERSDQALDHERDAHGL